MVIYFGWWWPFDSWFSTKMELFNEVTNLLLVYHMMTFTDWVDDPTMRYQIGYSVMVVVFMNMSIHFFFLILDTIRKTRLSIKKKMYLQKVAKLDKAK